MVIGALLWMGEGQLKPRNTAQSPTEHEALVGSLLVGTPYLTTTPTRPGMVPQRHKSEDSFPGGPPITSN